jgi:hypothetical protein
LFFGKNKLLLSEEQKEWNQGKNMLPHSHWVSLCSKFLFLQQPDIINSAGNGSNNLFSRRRFCVITKMEQEEFF